MNEHHSSFSKYSDNPKFPVPLYHLYTTYVYKLYVYSLLYISGIHFLFPTACFPSPTPTHLKKKKKIFLKFGPNISRNNMPVPQDWVEGK